MKSVWKTVLRLEWRILKRDRAALAVLALFAVFLVVAAYAGGRQAATVERGLDRAQADESARLGELQAKLTTLHGTDKPLMSADPRSAIWMGQKGAASLAVLPPAPLAPLAVGQRDLHPQAIRVNTDVHLTSERETETAMSAPTRLRTGAFDPAFLFVVLFPLVIIALSYELLSGERERGTLAMLLSQPVSQRALVLGKAGARAIALCGVTLLFAVLGLVVGGADLGSGAAWLHVGLYSAVLVAWALFWFAAAVAVNSLGGTSARNALTLVGAWLVLVVVVPGLVTVAVDTIYPPPSRIELVHEARESAREVEQKLSGLEGRHDMNTKTKDYANRVVAVQEELAQRSAPVLDEMRAQLRQRQEVTDVLRFVSPAMIVQLAFEDVAGSGATRHQRFEEQVDDFHKDFRAFFVSKIRDGNILTPTDLIAVPTLTFEEEPASTLIGRVAVGIVVLLVLAGLLLAFAWPRLQRIGRLTR